MTDGAPHAPDTLEARARQLATGLRPHRRAGRWRGFRRRAKALPTAIREAVEALAGHASPSTSIAAEWLLDNEHLVLRAADQVVVDLPPGFYRLLPKVEGETGDLTRVEALARESLVGLDGLVDVPLLERFLRAFQSVTALDIGELWALPAFLRLLVVEEVVDAAATARNDPRDSDVNARMAVAVGSLRVLDGAEWKAVVESVSVIDRHLRLDAGRAYARLDFDTRDRYRSAVETLARLSGLSEAKVARLAVATASEEREPVGSLLIGPNRRVFEARLGCRLRLSGRIARALRRRAGALYFGGLAGTTAAALVLLLWPLTDWPPALHFAWAAVAVLLALVPASSVALAVVNQVATRVVRPSRLPRLDFSNGLPDDARTVVAIPALLGDVGELSSLLRQLELNYRGNTSPNLRFALLVDPIDADQREVPDDARLLAVAEAGIRSLNDRYPNEPDRGPFLLLARDREWNPGEACWMAWERKRGKLHEFNRLLLGHHDTGLRFVVGDPTLLEGVRYVLTLDADTFLPEGAAARLAGTLAHPLNQPQFDARGSVSLGYTVLQPRIATLSDSRRPTWFSKVYQASDGFDLYSHAASDVYQDLFGEGIYAGKGLYDVRAFEQSLAGRVPENALLSHDLFEGLHGRCALVSDVTVIEDYPSRPSAYMRRLHRWARGDWQILPWLFPRVPSAGRARLRNRLSLLDRWKIFDNLRRSLLAVSLTALAVVGWWRLPAAAWWSAVPWIVVSVPVLLPEVVAALSRLRSPRRESAFRTSLSHLGWGVGRCVVGVAFLPWQTIVEADAIVRTLFRLAVSRRHRLQWESAAATAKALSLARRPLDWLREWGAAWLLPLMVAVVEAVRGTSLLVAQEPLLATWLLAPVLANGLARTVRERREDLSEAQKRRLRLLARRTWAYFDRLTTAEDHWLPPDNVQLHPIPSVARRTSPTNIGLGMLAQLVGSDLGYIPPSRLVAVLASMLDTLDRVERYRGHLLNWYDTRHLTPLAPRYVSSVDSGNLAACAITIREGLSELSSVSLPSSCHADGIADGLEVVAETIEAFRTIPAFRPGALPEEVRRMAEEIRDASQDSRMFTERLSALANVGLPTVESEVARGLETTRSEGTESLSTLRAWVRGVDRQTMTIHQEVETLLPWLDALRNAPTIDADTANGAAGRNLAGAWASFVEAAPASLPIRDIPATCEELTRRLNDVTDLACPSKAESESARQIRDWADDLAGRLETARHAAETLIRDASALRGRLDALVRDMDFSFLYDPLRRLLRVGYHVDAAALDRSYYDLYASEARIAGFIAIAKGDVPVEHWVHLGRPFARRDGTVVLLSWAGTMFEYLMPSLFLRTFSGSLADIACRRAIQVQMRLGADFHVPWGASESAYYQMDAHNVYRYKAFGASALSVRWNPPGRIVTTPYATALALAFDARAAVRNVQRLERVGMRGPLGLYEAADFGNRGGLLEPRVVRSFMAHHQGMILAALDNFLSERTLVRRFHRDPRIATFEYLLQEASPGRVRVATAPTLPEGAAPARPTPPSRLRNWEVDPDVFPVPTTVLSNGALSTLLGANGSGGLRWRGRDVLRWRPDPTAPSWGTWIYVRDVESDRLWSATLAPTWAPPDRYNAIFGADSVEFRRADHQIAMRTTITTGTSADVEIRRVTFVNESRRRRTVEVTSYAEAALSDPEEDRRHPAFSKLFVQGRYASRVGALLLGRRRRGDEAPIHVAHAVTGPEGTEPVAWALDRHAFVGRGGSARRPTGATRPARTTPADTDMAPLDPIISLTVRLELPPGEEVSVAFLTAVADEGGAALAGLDAYRSPARAHFAANQARDRARALLQELQVEADALPAFQRLLTAVVHPYHRLRRRPPSPSPVTGVPRQETLWSTDTSGDLPVVVVEAGDGADTLLDDLVRAQAYWERYGVRFDVIAVAADDDGYQQPLRARLERLLSELGAADRLDRPGGVHHVSRGRLGAGVLRSLRAAAALALVADGRSLSEQLERLELPEPRVPPFVPVPATEAAEAEIETVSRPVELQFDNGVGGFSQDGRAYVVHLDPGTSTPAPWANVVAHETFGFLVTESGGGFTWFQNSGERRLTTWRNDPVSDVPSEALYLRDEETSAIWSATPAPAPAPAAYRVTHRRGSTSFVHRSHGLDHRVEMFTPPGESVKIVEVTLANEWNRPRRLTATYFAEWVLGTHRSATAPHLSTEVSRSDSAVFARNSFSPGAAGLVAFVAASEPIHAFTCDRTEFLGLEGDFTRPAGLVRIGLEGRVGGGLDPCAALQVHLDFAPHETRTVRFLVGAESTMEAAHALLDRFRHPADSPNLAQTAHEFWEDTLERLTVRTPERTMDLMLNGWLLYQTVSCRLWGRSGYYQSSGAFGFRDQLQDSLALMAGRPALTRAQILDAARHQFVEGDVMHWWHPETDRGVRTRCSDDFLWLPFAVTEYLEATGDEAILDAPVEWMSGPVLAPDEVERYDKFDVRGASSLYEHCQAALENATARSERGIPLIGSGDWNDALNRVGLGGRGESMWLGWFLHAVETRFARIAERRGDAETARRLRADAESLRAAVEAHAWDGAWYLRATFDDGTPIGTATADEARIDSLTQSWAVLSDGADSKRARTAMSSVREHLVRTDERLVLLLTPPFQRSEPDPGYIRSYPPGVRENGGQYTHAGTWVGLAYAALGDGDRAEEIFRLLNPILHARSPETAALYRVEPYVTAGDVYGAPPHTGKGGWTWYTGSAGWMYRLGMEGILGLRPVPEGLEIRPCIPRHWPEYEATLHVGTASTSYRIVVRNPEGLSTGTVALRLDGRPLEGAVIPLDDDGLAHEVEAVLESSANQEPEDR